MAFDPLDKQIIYTLEFFNEKQHIGEMRKIALGNKWMPDLAFLPLIAMLFDGAENLCIVSLLCTYPQKLMLIAQLGGIFTLFKWIFAFTDMGVGLIGLVLWALKGLGSVEPGLFLRRK